jgi:hypothetical protein
MDKYTDSDIDRLLHEELSKLKNAINKIDDSNKISQETSKQFVVISEKIDSFTEIINRIEEAYKTLNESSLTKSSLDDLKYSNENIESQIAKLNNDLTIIQQEIDDLSKSYNSLLLFKERIKKEFNQNIAEKLKQYITKEILNSDFAAFESKIELKQKEIDELLATETANQKLFCDNNTKEIESVFKYLNDFESKIHSKIEKLSNSNLLKFRDEIAELKSSLLKKTDLNSTYASKKEINELNKVLNEKLASVENNFNSKISATKAKTISEFELIIKKQENQIKFFKVYNLSLSLLFFVLLFLNLPKLESIFSWLIHYLSRL